MSTQSRPLPIPALPVRRCARCYYVIEHLEVAGNCPECGTSFNLEDPYTFTIKPPFVRWKFWLPAWGLALLCGMMLYVPLILYSGYGWASVIAVPLFIGVLFGYRLRISSTIAIVLLCIWLSIGLIIGLGTLNLVGALCGLTLGSIAFGPILLGTAVGIALRKSLKRSKFSQRAHLPIFLLVPALLAVIEGRHLNMPPVVIATSMTIDASPDQVWKSIQFYEQVKHRPPLLLWISPSLRPKYTTGHSEKVGDQKVCVYEAGHLVKEITEVVPGKRLAFRVVEQVDIENRGVRLIDGSFNLEPTSDGMHTIVTLHTRYEPLLAPRFAFLPAEQWCVHTLHGHVLNGMKMDSEEAAIK